MPRVSAEYRANRRTEIVLAAARRFAHDGFHATSMADVISESGLSAGAVYGYFRSKDELIAAVAGHALAAADEIFGELLAGRATPSPARAVTTLIEDLVERVANDPATGQDLTRIAVQIWGEALRNPAMRSLADATYEGLRRHCAEVARRWQAAGNLSPGADPDQIGAAMLGLIQGFLIQRLLMSGTTVESYVAGVQALLPGEPAA